MSAQAACRSSHVDPDSLFVPGAAQKKVARICTPCGMRLACLAEALQAGIEYGVWGGMTERERRNLRRRHPDVRDWSAFLHQAKQSDQRHLEAHTAA